MQRGGEYSGVYIEHRDDFRFRVIWGFLPTAAWEMFRWYRKCIIYSRSAVDEAIIKQRATLYLHHFRNAATAWILSMSSKPERRCVSISCRRRIPPETTGSSALKRQHLRVEPLTSNTVSITHSSFKKKRRSTERCPPSALAVRGLELNLSCRNEFLHRGRDREIFVES